MVVAVRFNIYILGSLWNEFFSHEVIFKRVDRKFYVRKVTAILIPKTTAKSIVYVMQDNYTYNC
jgi:hypothetical protein